MEELTLPEIEVLAVLAINAITTREFCPGVSIHPTLVNRLDSAYTKLIKSIEEGR
jgi:predicted DNA-binding protein (UPF0251 family)